jgi:hypothetical protein
LVLGVSDCQIEIPNLFWELLNHRSELFSDTFLKFSQNLLVLFRSGNFLTQALLHKLYFVLNVLHFLVVNLERSIFFVHLCLVQDVVTLPLVFYYFELLLQLIDFVELLLIALYLRFGLVSLLLQFLVDQLLAANEC